MAKTQSKNQKRRNDKQLDQNGGEPSAQPRGKTKSARHKADEAWTRQTNAPLVCRNDAQKGYLKCIKDHVISFGVGPAGTGKTHVSVKYACEQIDKGQYKGLVILRPLVEMGKSLGALPGELHEKMAPWAEPFLKVLREHYGEAAMQAKFNGAHPSIRFLALQHVRGRTFDDCFVILDEAQNTTPKEMKTILTRLGENSKLVLNGDIDQVDIPGQSGMVDSLDLARGVPGMGVATFTEEDVIRSGIVRDMLIAYRERGKAHKAGRSWPPKPLSEKE